LAETGFVKSTPVVRLRREDVVGARGHQPRPGVHFGVFFTTVARVVGSNPAFVREVKNIQATERPGRDLLGRKIFRRQFLDDIFFLLNSFFVEQFFCRTVFFVEQFFVEQFFVEQFLDDIFFLLSKGRTFSLS
jgi:hypothetical protein